jgi:hypothetical protein
MIAGNPLPNSSFLFTVRVPSATLPNTLAVIPRYDHETLHDVL